MARTLRREDYTVGWVCALPVELAAAQEMLDEEHNTPRYDARDTNLYTCGSIGEHNVIVACLPEGQMGTNSAAAVAVQMKSTFKSTRFCLMVGIGGGVPSEEADVRLGDVVVSKPHNTHGGVVQYDSGKATPSGFERTGALNAPPTVLLNAVANLRAKQMRGKARLLEYLSKLDSLPDFSREVTGSDTLFEAGYNHVGGGATCGNCSIEHAVTREARRQEVIVHHGTIASGNQLIKDAAVRDKLSAELGGVLCFETEAAGLMNSFPCLVVRGICDYADSHKNKRWQAYAAGTAAAYAKELLLVVPAADVIGARTVEETTRAACKHASERTPSPYSKRRRLDPVEPSGIAAAHQQDFTLARRVQIKQTAEATTERSLQVQECLRSLAFPEQEHRFDDIHTVVDDTCKWLLEDAKYQAWMEGTSGLFWIKGDPGAGKSVLMKHSVKMMRERSLDDIVVSFFFHGQGTPLQKTLLGLYRALLASMLEHFPEDLTHLAVKFAEKEKRYGRFSERRWEWTEKELQALLSSVLAKGTQCQPVVVFIDALDECGEAPAKSLLAYFKDLTSQVESGDARFRICLSSRHYPILSLDTIPSVQVEQRNNQDIRRYIHMKLRDIRPKSKREQIKTEILSKSHGGFQWAILVTRTVLDRNLIGIKAEKLLEELNSCPQTLGEIYEAIFNSVPETDQYQMAKIFQWVQFAERPLSAQELRDALATDQDMSHRSISDLHAYEGWSNSLDDFERHVKHISRGLIRFQSREMWEQYEPNGEDSDREAQLIHQSVADFLTDQFSNSVRNHVPTIQSSAGPSHFQISRSCLRYMTLEEILENAHLPRGTLSSMFPLAPYAVRFLFAHIQKVEEEGITQSDLLSVLRWRPGSELMRKLARLWRTLDPDSVHTPLGWPFVKATALHVLVAFGSMSAVNVFFESGCDETDSRDADRNTPLMLAIREGHQNIALALLDRYVEREGRHEQHDPDSECGATQLSVARVADINAQNEDGDTALNIALDQQMGEVILKLIEAGADLKYLGRPIALVAHAVSSRNTKLLSILIENELNLDGAVFFALKDQLSQRDPALEGIVSQLLCAGANTARSSELNDLPQPDDFEYYEEYKGADDGRFDSDALALATRQDLAGVVELLLANDAPAALQNDLGQCPLLIATSYGHAEIVQMLLLKAPSSVETVDGDGDTALSIAIFMGELEIAKLLLQEGSFSSIPLLEKCFLDAARSGATDIVGIVLQRELLDLEFAHAEGRLPLCLAAQNGHAAVVQLLLNTGKVDPDLRDNDGFTALSWAAASGHEAVVKLLLDTNGVNFGAKSTNGNTPLSLAARSGHETVVKLLLDTNGVEFNVKNANGNTPLLLAVESGQEAVVKLLLNTNGVDFNAKNGYGNTPLLVAVQSGQEAVVKLLLDTNGVDFNMKSSNGNTPLSWAAENGHRGVVKLLLNTGKVDSNHKNEHARTALSLAAENGHAAVVQQLLRADKVDPDSTDNDGLTALSWAIVRRHEAVVKLLLD